MLDIAPLVPASPSGSVRNASRAPRRAELHAKRELASVTHSLPYTSRPCESLISPSHRAGMLPYALIATAFVHRHRPTIPFIVRPQHGAHLSAASGATPHPLVEMPADFSAQLPSLRSRWRGYPGLPVRAECDLRGHQGTSAHTRESCCPGPPSGRRLDSIRRYIGTPRRHSLQPFA
jgi:hypothetical protein